MGTGGRRKARLWSFSCCPLGLCTSPYPCISEMLIQGHVPEELSAKSGPACSGRMSRLICKEAISSPQGNGSAFRLKSSLQFCARSSLRRQCCSHPGRGCWFTWEPAPETVGKTEMQGFLRRRRILTSCHSWACKSQMDMDITNQHADLKVVFPQRPENQDSLNYKPTRLDQHDPLDLANPPSRRGTKPKRRAWMLRTAGQMNKAWEQGLLRAGIEVFATTPGSHAFRHRSPEATHLALGFLFAVLSKDDASTCISSSSCRAASKAAWTLGEMAGPS